MNENRPGRTVSPSKAMAMVPPSGRIRQRQTAARGAGHTGHVVGAGLEGLKGVREVAPGVLRYRVRDGGGAAGLAVGEVHSASTVVRERRLRLLSTVQLLPSVSRQVCQAFRGDCWSRGLSLTGTFCWVCGGRSAGR
jgi:hypothetical protein